MKVSELSRDEFKQLIDQGWVQSRLLRHFDVCNELRKGKKLREIAVSYGYSELKSITEIKRRRCPDCR